LAWLAVMGMNRALVAEPMIVLDSPEESTPDRGLAATLLVGCVFAAGLAVVAGALQLLGVPAVALLALAPWIPSLLAQDYFRLMAFRLQRPQQALITDLAFVAAQAMATAVLYALGELSVQAFLATWGIGATVGVIAGFAIHGGRTCARRGGLVHLRGLWSRGRWLLADYATSFVASQGYLLLLPILLSTAEFGLYKAGASLIAPIALLFTVTLNVGLPECVRRLHMDGTPGVRAYVPKLAAAVVALTSVYCGGVALMAAPLLRLTYGAEFAGAATVVTILTAISCVIMSSSVGYCIGLKAVQRLWPLSVVRLVGATIAIGSTVVLAESVGFVGVGYASIFAEGVYAVGIVGLYYCSLSHIDSGKSKMSGDIVSTTDRRAVFDPHFLGVHRQT
jgi:O-antigen/teichoic acid export membrane protein